MRMRAAIPTNDKIRLFRRSGTAKGFLIVDVLNNGHSVVDFRVNTHTHDHTHGENKHHGHSHKEIVESLKDCQYMVVNIVGKHFGKDLKDAGIKVFKTDAEIISEAIVDFKDNL